MSRTSRTSGTSRAAVLYGPGDLRIEEFPLPEIRADDGLLEVEATGVCGTDMAAYHGVNPFYELPCALGHELVGRIVEIGPAAGARWNVSAGDRVVVEEYLPCGTCRSCLAGAYQMCDVPRYGGKSVHSGCGLFGGYSDYLYLHPQAIVHKVADDIPAELVQLYIPLSNGLDWVAGIGGLRPGGTVVIVGPGPHGLSCVVGAREAGAGTVVVVGRPADGTRLDVARALGADHTLTGDLPEVLSAVQELTGGVLADTVINAADSSAALETATAVAGNRATVVQAGLAKGGGGGAEALVDAMNRKVLTLRGVRGRPSRMVPPTLRLIESGRYPLERMCTGRFPIEQTEHALTVTARDPSAIRSSIIPGLV
ncbi:alcohol dehydrogenase catalytic domain-containing protein [Streptomyces sp. SID10853]|uniref:alcohol dehydrogenase catalytic domain-containing protein n=1 Tax=Streptomyces sp. SID10853 TaxID=2706028 RepID=UPI0013C27BEA|nr:alcohol dehydrogenase catalytic domain-containing protein [Streptomyces sp. SID10853]